MLPLAFTLWCNTPDIDTRPQHVAHDRILLVLAAVVLFKAGCAAAAVNTIQYRRQ